MKYIKLFAGLLILVLHVPTFSNTIVAAKSSEFCYEFIGINDNDIENLDFWTEISLSDFDSPGCHSTERPCRIKTFGHLTIVLFNQASTYKSPRTGLNIVDVKNRANQ